MKFVDNEEELIPEKYIYKVTNKINNKVYIGQTNDYVKRFRTHKKLGYKKENNILYKAIKKYGVENFEFEVIDYGSNYNELEKYYIKYYDSINNGYNISPGGENPPIHQGENSFHAKHTLKEINKLKEDIKNTNKSFKELATEYNFKNYCSIERINIGKSWYDKNEEYPLRNTSNDEIIDNIINLLKNTNLTQKEIAKKLKIKRSTVTMTNLGKHNKRSNEDYPIRSKTKTIIMRNKEYYSELIKYIILHPEEKLSSISKKLNISRDMVYHINNGKYYKDNKYKYPLNKNKNII